MVEAFKKPFSIYIQLSPEAVISRVENMKDKNTDIQVTPLEIGGFELEISRKWGLTSPYLRFRVWQPEPNIKFSQIDGEAGAVIALHYFFVPMLMAIPLACCFCTTVLFFPPDPIPSFADLLYTPLKRDDTWDNFHYLVGITVLIVGLILLNLLSSPFASISLLKEFRHYFPDENEDEKKKRG